MNYVLESVYTFFYRSHHVLSLLLNKPFSLSFLKISNDSQLSRLFFIGRASPLLSLSLRNDPECIEIRPNRIARVLHAVSDSVQPSFAFTKHHPD